MLMIDSNKQFDAIIIGGGHNGLVCSFYLAKAGKRVLLVEASDSVGGGCSTTQFYDQFKVSSCAQWLYQLNPKVASDLKLTSSGLEIAAKDLSTIVLSETGDHLTITSDGLSGNQISEEDIAAYKKFSAQFRKFAKFLASAFDRRPPKLIEGNLTDRITALKLGLGMKLMGKADMRDLMRLALINIYDVMEENFDNELLKAGISLDAVLGTHMGPRSPNTVYSYLYRKTGDIFGFQGPTIPKGGMGSISNAMEKSAKAAGVEIITGKAVKKINLDLDRVTGITLDDGTIFKSDRVVSSADPRTTHYDLIGKKNLETGIVRRVRGVRMKGNAAKLHLALKEIPNFNGLTKEQMGQRLIVAPNMKYIEDAFNACKYGDFSENPALDISIPTVHDSSMAPEGKHVMSVIVQYAPCKVNNGWEIEKSKLEAIVINKISEYAPDIKSKIIFSELMTPEDIENRHLNHGGHWHHGEISLDQILVMRPFPGSSQYRTVIDGVFLCGAGTHPGGGVMGLAGYNAAQEVIRSIK